MDKTERIIEVLDNLAPWELIQVWNDYCDNSGDPDSIIYDMGDLEEFTGGMSATELIDIGSSGFNTNDSYFQASVYWNSFNDWDLDNYIYTSDIADYIERNEDSLGISEIDDILYEDEDEYDEDEYDEDED